MAEILVTALYAALLVTLSLGVLGLAKGPNGGSTGLAGAQQDAKTMSNDPVGSAGKSCEDKCPKCGRKKHDTGRYPRSKAEKRKTLLRDAEDPNSDLAESARKFIRKHEGENVPPGYEVSHEEPLYTVPKADRCELDKADNMKTQPRKTHRDRHKRCGQQFHDFPG